MTSLIQTDKPRQSPFLNILSGCILIHHGITGRVLPATWTGICVDDNNTKAFWLIGQDNGERSFTKLPTQVTSLKDATEFLHVQKTAAKQSASLSQKAQSIWQSLANEKAVVTDALPAGFRADWITMNATRPLYGDLVVEDSPYLSGRWYACIDPEVEFAAELVMQNLRNDCKVVVLASAELRQNMAIKTLSPRYMTSYEGMSENVQSAIVTPLVKKLNRGKTYVELKHLMSEATRYMTDHALIAMAKR